MKSVPHTLAEETGHGLVLETNVIAPEGPPVILGVEMISKGERAPYQWIINSGIRSCQTDGRNRFC